MRVHVFLVLALVALAAGASASESAAAVAAATTTTDSSALAASDATVESAAAALDSHRARTGFLPKLPKIPSPSSIFNDAKDRCLREVRSLLPSVDSLKSSIGNPVKNAISSAQTSTTNALNQALRDTQNWASSTVNNELTTMLTALDTARSGFTNEINSLKNLAESAKTGLSDLYNSLSRMMSSTFTLTVNLNCPLPTTITQINTLAKDYAGINSLIPQDKWCTAVALMEKLRGGSSATLVRTSSISASATSFLEKMSRVNKINIHSNSFIEAAAGMQVKVGDLAYSCPKMLSASDALDGGYSAAHLCLSAIDSNTLDVYAIQPPVAYLGILIRASTVIMRSVCAFYKKLDDKC